METKVRRCVEFCPAFVRGARVAMESRGEVPGVDITPRPRKVTNGPGKSSQRRRAKERLRAKRKIHHTSTEQRPVSAVAGWTDPEPIRSAIFGRHTESKADANNPWDLRAFADVAIHSRDFGRLAERAAESKATVKIVAPPRAIDWDDPQQAREAIHAR